MSAKPTTHTASVMLMLPACYEVTFEQLDRVLRSFPRLPGVAEEIQKQLLKECEADDE